VNIAGEHVKLHVGQCPQASTVTWEADAISLPLNAGRTDVAPAQFTVTIGGRPVKAIFDTASTHSTLNHETAAELGMLRPPDAVTVHSVGAGENRAPAWRATVTDIVIGTQKIPSASLMIQTTTTKGGSSMILGLDYIRNHRILFLLGQNRIMIKPNGKAVFSLPAQP
jgi:hypothetical protein